MDGLEAISGCDNPERALDLVFVHGLDGDRDATWQHPENPPGDFWPAWLGEKFPQIGVWSFGYQVSASAWKGHSMPLADRALNALDQFELDGLGRRPLGFVCHSLGGLLIKQALRSALELGDPRFRPICEQTAFILFLATPHTGSDFANWVNYIGTLLRTTVSVEELEAHHPRLRELNQWYRNRVGELGIDTYVYFETRKTKGVQVVDASSADPGIAGLLPIPVDADHVTICKPASRQQPIYRRTERILTDRLRALQTATAAAQTPEEAPALSGEQRLAFAQRLGDSWAELADLLEIPGHQRRGFAPGHEPRAILEWLEERHRLAELTTALVQIGRPDLAELFPPNP